MYKYMYKANKPYFHIDCVIFTCKPHQQNYILAPLYMYKYITSWSLIPNHYMAHIKFSSINLLINERKSLKIHNGSLN